MRTAFYSIVKISWLCGIIYAMTFTSHAFAKERYVCATVSKILETESEDCMYFIVKGKTVDGKNLSICIDDDGNDFSKDSQLALYSFEKNKKIYILIDGDSVRKIKKKCL
ncbi:hypothetical protein [Chromatium okenii]|jgi:hypothetical protein|nr:hypothetical protein [Chromatium okenii]